MDLAEEVAQKVLSFAKSPRRNAWLGDQFHIYVRNSIRRDGKTLDLASFEMDEDLQHQGIFKRFLSILEDRSDVPLYIENVLNPHLQAFLQKRPGWVIMNPPGHWGTFDSFYFKKD